MIVIRKKMMLITINNMQGTCRNTPVEESCRKHFSLPTFGLTTQDDPPTVSSIPRSARMIPRVHAPLDPQATTEYRTNFTKDDPRLGTLARWKVQHRSKLMMVIQLNMEMVKKYPA